MGMKYGFYLKEFDRQTENLLKNQYPAASGMSESEFLGHIQPLKDILESIPDLETDNESGHLPFVIVVKHTLIKPEIMMQHVERNGKNGIIKLSPHTAEEFKTIESVHLPPRPIYLLHDIDRGKEFLNVRPQDAFVQILKRKRSPLTIDEGIAVVFHHPDFLMKNNCFSLLASRIAGKKEVPAIWINSAKQPNLGWCWDGNPHTWLGSASCGGRL